MFSPLLLFSGFLVAVIFLVVASSHSFAWLMAGLMVLMLLAMLMLFTVLWFPRWPETPLQTDARRRRRFRTVMDILYDDMKGL